jgi:hypothetical protein
VLLARPDSSGRHSSCRYSVTLTGISLHHCLLSGDCWIIHLDLLVLTARGYAYGTSGAMMRGRGLAPRPCAGSLPPMQCTEMRRHLDSPSYRPPAA